MMCCIYLTSVVAIRFFIFFLHEDLLKQQNIFHEGNKSKPIKILAGELFREPEGFCPLIPDPIKTAQGSLSLKAYRLTPKLMEICKEKDFTPEA